MALSRLGLDGYGVRRSGSFSGKAASGSGSHPVGVLSRLALDGYGARRAGSFSGKAEAGGGTHPVGLLTRLSLDGYGVRRAGSFTGKAAVASIEEVIVRGGGGAIYPVYYQGRRKRKRKLEDFPNRHLDFILDKVVSEIFGEIVDAQVSTEIKADAYEIVAPFIREEPNNTFQVDWKALQKDFQRVNHLIYLWQEEILSREIDDEDELLLLMGY